MYDYQKHPDTARSRAAKPPRSGRRPLTAADSLRQLQFFELSGKTGSSFLFSKLLKFQGAQLLIRKVHSSQAEVTKRLLNCSELLGVKMLDHVIIGGKTGEMYRFKSDGLLDQLRPARAVWER